MSQNFTVGFMNAVSSLVRTNLFRSFYRRSVKIGCSVPEHYSVT